MKSLLCLLFFVSVNNLFAQLDTNLVYFFDTAYIQLNHNTLSLGVFVPSKSVEFAVRTAKSEQEINFQPNGTGALGFSFAYHKYQIKLAFRTNSFSNDPTRYGETKSFDFRVNHFGRRWIFDAHFLNYKGFYISNPRDFIPGWETKGPMPISGLLQASSLGISAIKIRNDYKFSYKAAYTQNETQLKSAGSFLSGYFFQICNIGHPESMVPVALKASVDSALHLKNVSLINGGVSFGYAHTFVLRKHFFVSFSLVPGLGLQATNLERIYSADPYNRLGFSVRVLSDACFGYKGEKYFAGISARSESLSYGGKKQLLEFEISQASFYVGRRFGSVGVEKAIKKVRACFGF